MQLLRTAACLFAAATLASAKEKVIGKLNTKISREQIHALHHLMDKDGSGKVSLKEMLKFHVNTQESVAYLEAKELFKWIDKNGDMKVPYEELENWLKIQNHIEGKWLDGEQAAWREMKHNRIHSFKIADKDKDGVLNPQEIVGFLFPDTDFDQHQFRSKQNFAAWDRDGDRFLSSKEFLAGDHHDPADLMLTEIEEEEFKILDLNFDGKLDPEEFTMVHSLMYQTSHDMKVIMSRADADEDGKVDVMELDEAYEKIRDSESAHKLLKDAVKHHEL